MLFVWKWCKIPSLREIDNKIDFIAQGGFCAASIDTASLEASSLLAEALKGCCRSGYKYGVDIYLCVSDYSAVSSVPELRSETGLNSENPKSARFVWDIMLRPLLRKLSAFCGKELKGIILRSPEKNPSPAFYSEINAMCEKSALRAVAADECAVIPQGSEGAFFLKLHTLFTALENHPCAMALLDNPSPSPADVGYPIFNLAADALCKLFASSPERISSDDCLCIYKCNDATVFFAKAACEKEITVPEGQTAVVRDIAGDAAYNFSGGRVYFEKGGVLVMSATENPSFNQAAPAFLKCAVSLCPHGGRELPLIAVEAGDNRLFVKGSFSVESLYDEIFLNYSDENTLLNAQKLKGEKTADGFCAPVNELLRLGSNTIEPEGELFGDFYADERNIVAQMQITPGDVSKMGMPYYCGELVYEVKLPENVTSENYLILKGDFAAATAEIGRRRENLIFPPFALKLFAADSGRVAKIRIYTSEKSDIVKSFGLYSAEIL